MFAFIASTLLSGGGAECGICGTRGKSYNSLPTRPASTRVRTASLIGVRKQSCVVYYPEDVRSPLKSRRDTEFLEADHVITYSREDHLRHHDAYETELNRCRTELAKGLKQERKRLSGPSHSLSSVELNCADEMRLRHRRTMDSLRSPKPTPREEVSACLPTVQTPHTMRQRFETDFSVESDNQDNQSESNGQLIDELYEAGNVSARVEAIRHKMEVPNMDKLNRSLPDGPRGTHRHTGVVQQRQQKQTVQAEIDAYQVILREKLERLGANKQHSPEPIGSFKRHADPAQAVCDGVYRYHERCEEVFENSMGTRQHNMLQGFKRDLKAAF